jgi:predicted lipoprotein with Yx(FWY)xxD motif
VTKTTYGLALLIVAALAIAGCGGEGDSSGGSAYGGKGGSSSGGDKAAESKENPAATGASGGNAGIVSVAEVGELGAILVDSEGRTLYDFHKDQGASSSCYGACAIAWPPLLTDGDPQAQGEAEPGKLGTTERKDGKTQVTYGGHPLYTYVGDEGPGEANGNDIDQFGAEWYALQPNGEEPED